MMLCKQDLRLEMPSSKTIIFKVFKVNYWHRMVLSGFGHFPNFGPLFLWVWELKNVCYVSFVISHATCNTIANDFDPLKWLSHQREELCCLESPHPLPPLVWAMYLLGPPSTPQQRGNITQWRLGAQHGSLCPQWPVTPQNYQMTVLQRSHTIFTRSLSLDRKLEHPWSYRPVLSPELKSSLQPCLPYLDTVLREYLPPVTNTVSVSGSGIEQAALWTC